MYPYSGKINHVIIARKPYYEKNIHTTVVYARFLNSKPGSSTATQLFVAGLVQAPKASNILKWLSIKAASIQNGSRFELALNEDVGVRDAPLLWVVSALQPWYEASRAFLFLGLPYSPTTLCAAVRLIDVQGTGQFTILTFALEVYWAHDGSSGQNKRGHHAVWPAVCCLHGFVHLVLSPCKYSKGSPRKLPPNIVFPSILPIYVHIYIYIYTICVYIYTEREGERANAIA